MAFRPRGKARMWLSRAVLALSSSIAALVAAEAVIRVSGIAPQLKVISISSADSAYQRSSNPILGYELKANFRHSNPDLVESFERTNAHGQRDLERAVAKSVGSQRILLLGDSVVEGLHLREADTISRQLELLFANVGTEVLNFGVSGYCTRSEVELLATKGLKFHPDIVILLFVQNDFDDFNNRDRPVAGSVDRPAIAKFLFVKSELFRMAAIRLNLYGFGFDAAPYVLNHAAIGQNNVVEGLARLRALAIREHFRPVVVIWPQFLSNRVEDAYAMPGSRELVIERLAKMYGIASVRVSPYFIADLQSRGRNDPRLLYTTGDTMHPSPEGARVAAAALKQIITTLNADGGPLALGKMSEDARAIEAAMEVSKKQPNVELMMSANALEQDRFDDAVRYCQAVLKADPHNDTAYVNLGMARMGQGRLDEAKTHFERAIQLNAENDLAYSDFALVLLRQGNLDLAKANSERAIAINPENHFAWNNLGMVLVDRGDFSTAEAHFKRCLEIKPDYFLALNNLGMVLLENGRLVEARSAFVRCLELKPDYIKAQENLLRVDAMLRSNVKSPNQQKGVEHLQQ